MQTLLLKPTKEGIEKAVNTIKQGGLIIYPTETCYGIGCDPFNETAVNRVTKIKERVNATGYLVLCSNIKQAETYGYITKEEKELARSKIPTTIISKRKEVWPKFVGPDFAFRISPNPVARKIVKYFGKPILSTSANIAKNPEVYSPRIAYDIFNGKVDIVIDGGLLHERKPSRIIKDGKIIRE